MDEIQRWEDYAVECMNYNIIIDIAVFWLYEKLIDADKSRDINKIYKNREQEGTFKVLVERHLKENDSQFREYFRLTPYEFNEVLSSIRVDIDPMPTNFINNPISAEHKLCITLR